jgi:hypothetical protein
VKVGELVFTFSFHMFQCLVSITLQAYEDIWTQNELHMRSAMFNYNYVDGEVSEER